MESVRKTGLSMGKVRIMGGPTKSPVWNQIQADLYGVQAETLAIPDASVLGAAITGAVGTGLFPGFEEAVNKLVRVDQVYIPNPENTKRYNELYQVYREAYEGLAGSGAFDSISRFQASFA